MVSILIPVETHAMRDWLNKNCPKRYQIEWDTGSPENPCRLLDTIHFERDEDASLFVLRWAE